MNTYPGLHRIRIPLGQRFADLWLFLGNDSHLLFDAGTKDTMITAVVPALTDLGYGPESISQVVVSHLDVDHCGDVGQLRDVLPNAHIIAHRDDAGAIADMDTFWAQRGREFLAGWGLDESPEAISWMEDVFVPGPVDDIIDQEFSITLDSGRVIDVVHVPGHSWGHLALYDRDQNLLAISDAILGHAVPLADGSDSFPPTYRHIDTYLATIARVRQMAPDVLLTAHYGDFVGDEIGAFLDRSEEFVHRLGQLVKDAITHEPKTLADLVAEINPRIATWPQEGSLTALAFPVAGHIEQLHALGHITRHDSPRGWEWTT
jgi:glyoxylase-like metal-dependent hydrolase (beta-lactamase superfamily II)